MMAPSVGLLCLPRWAWGPLSVPYKPGTPVYRKKTKNNGTHYRYIWGKVSRSHGQDKE
jgi:hypothetical protein